LSVDRLINREQQSFLETHTTHSRDLIENNVRLDDKIRTVTSNSLWLDASSQENLKQLVANLRQHIQTANKDIEIFKANQNSPEFIRIVKSRFKIQEPYQLLDTMRSQIIKAKNLLTDSIATMKERGIVVATEVETSEGSTEESSQQPSNEDNTTKSPTEELTTDSFRAFKTILASRRQDNSSELLQIANDLEVILRNPTPPPEALTTYFTCMEKAAEIASKRDEHETAFALRAKIAERSLGPNHPLKNLSEAVETAARDQQSSVERGAYFEGLNTGNLKRGQVEAFRRKIDGKNILQSTLHVSTPARKKLEDTLAVIKNNPESFVAALSSSLGTNVKVSINEVEDGYMGKNEDKTEYTRNLARGISTGKAVEIRFKGIGRVRIGSEKLVASSYRKVKVEVEETEDPLEATKRMHAMLSMLGLGSTLAKERPEDVERKKVALLFRTCSPSQAWILEQKPEFYEGSPEQLKINIIAQAPQMEGVFSRILDGQDTMVKVECGPGQMEWAIPNISASMRKKGAVGLMMGFNGSATVMASVIANGPLCSQERFERGMISTGGVSCGQDHNSGGAGSCFLRIVTKRMMEGEVRDYIDPTSLTSTIPASDIRRYPHHGTCQFCYDLGAVDRGAYAYPHDRYGSKSENHYATRPTLSNLTSKLDQNNVDNEIMIRGQIPKGKLRKIVCRTVEQKQLHIQELRKANCLVQREGAWYIKGYDEQPVGKLFVVSKSFTEELWD